MADDLNTALKYRKGSEARILEKIRELGLMKATGCYLNNEKVLISVGSRKDEYIENIMNDLAQLAVDLFTEDALVGRQVNGLVNLKKDQTES